jgi:TolB-like protein
VAGFLTELKRRNVFRVGVAYLVVAWLVVQIVNNLVPLLDVPAWVGRAVLILLVAGLPIALIVAWAFELTPQGIKLTSAGEGSATRYSTPGRKWDFVIIAALAVALGLALWQRGDSPPPETSVAAAGRAAQDAVPSIAVLPFLNLSSDPEQEYFSDGLADELLNKLAKLDGLRVAARTSSFTFKNSSDDLRRIAEKLGVDNVLEGSVRKAGDRIRVTAQLNSAANGSHLWSETYERRLNDIFSVQEEIAEAVATALSGTLGVADRQRLTSSTRNLEAYDHYLSGISLLNEFGRISTERGVAELERATAIDPAYADAWAVLAISYAQRAYTVTRDFEAAQQQIEETARHALALNPDLAPAHAALGHVHFLRREWAAAEEAFRTALSIPSDFVVSWDYAEFLVTAGYLEEALESRKLARQAMPLNVAPAVDLAEAYLFLRDDARAEAEIERATELVGDRFSIAAARDSMAMARNDRETLERGLRNAVAASPGDAVASALLSALTSSANARDVLQGLRGQTAGNIGRQLQLAAWAAYLSEPDLALEYAREPALKAPLLAQALWAPVMRDARRRPAFKTLMRELRLVEFWRSRGWPTLCRAVGADDFECD